MTRGQPQNLVHEFVLESSQSLDFLAGNIKNFDGAKIIAESKDAVGNAFAVRRPGYEARKFLRSIGCDAQNGLVAAVEVGSQKTLLAHIRVIGAGVSHAMTIG